MPDILYRSFRKPAPFAGFKLPYEIYTQDEADEKAIDYLSPWYLCNSGDWVLTDDGFVMQCVRRTKMPPSKGCSRGGFKIVFTGAVTMFDVKYADRAKLLWLPRRELSSEGYVDYNSHRVETYMQRFMRGAAYSRAVDLYINLWLAKRGKLTKKDLENVGRMANPYDRKPHLRTKWMLKRKVIQEDVMRRLAEVLQGMDVSYKEVVDTVRDAIKVAKEEGSAAQMLHGADFMFKMLSATDPSRKGNTHNEYGGSLPIEAEWDYAGELEEHKGDALPASEKINYYEEQDNPALGIKLDD
jgi:hypothetical protein